LKEGLIKARQIILEANNEEKLEIALNSAKRKLAQYNRGLKPTLKLPKKTNKINNQPTQCTFYS
jgi:hypothetical protein